MEDPGRYFKCFKGVGVCYASRLGNWATQHHTSCSTVYRVIQPSLCPEERSTEHVELSYLALGSFIFNTGE